MPSPRPAKLYEQVKAYLREGIASGIWKVGEKIPSEFELMERLGASRMTVHRALRELSAEGVLLRLQGAGSFVQAPAPRSPLLEIHDIAEDIARRGHAHRAQVLALEARPAPADIAAEFALRPRARLFYSEILHFEDEIPVQLEQRYVSPGFAPDYLAQDFTRQTPNRYLQTISPPSEVEHVIHATLADAKLQALLRLDPQDACLCLLRRTWTPAGPATRSLLTHPGSRYSLGSRYKLADFHARPG
ncbi:histidine utilization repressor [Acidocella sp. MX-AZ03]|nr:histidine utilization repressor [Acidocella sp. MX-AZ03]WBO61145.1 histidine utilization repressor [Acidocella sp. MX-AZ03]